MFKQIALFSIFVLLTGCANTPSKPQTTIRNINTISVPELPDIQPVPPVALLPWTADAPRDTSKLTVKNITRCVSVPEDERDESFWINCGENPLIPQSNIYIGFDQENWNIIIGNFAKLKEQLALQQRRIDLINKQRRAWREQAESDRALRENENQAIIDELNTDNNQPNDGLFNKWFGN